MKRKIAALLALTVLAGAFSGCGTSGGSAASGTAADAAESESDSADSAQESADDSGQEEAAAVQEDSEMFTDRDYETAYEESGSVLIQLEGSTASASSDSVQISGTTVTLTEEAVYVISGTLDDGMIIVNAPDTAKLQLVFNGVSISSSTSAALYVQEADKVFVTLADGTENTLSNGGTFTAIDDSNIDSVIFSKQDLTLNGSGSLTVESPAGHGIVSNDDLVLTGGNYTVTSASHALKANDSVRITGETVLAADAGKDGIHAENDEDTSLGFVYISGGTFDLEAEGDGISAGSTMQISDGSFGILAGGGSENGSSESSESWGGFRGGGPGRVIETAAASETEEDSSTSMKGMKAAGSLTITGGSFSIDSADDSVHSNASAAVNGGTFEIASGDDAFHADDTLTITAGTVNISESYEGLEATHVDIQGGDITLTASDDGVNAAGGTDASGTEGGRDGMFGGGPGGNPGGGPGGGMSASSDGSISISGGTLYVTASGDGIDANGTLTISGGYTVVTGPTQGDTATLDYDVSAAITGGTFIGTGGAGMAQTFSDSEQGVVSLSVGNQSAGTTISLADQEGNTLLSCTPALEYAVVILSCPELVSGGICTVTIGETSQEAEAA